ncbi:DNA replication/repair protein RecF [Fulvivirga sp. M361]|uniref:DNA replication/repair protein RecF n=1 Tax=Fulvivirga sp. M361 TaxID=2594266 RepID=UPI00117AAD52|nr:DNA replication/repair protein RecF [Fulvivirga sp. M361]TRX55593.1 DNA replication/repair protein RecF [Fulvivirga sp. M361]
MYIEKLSLINFKNYKDLNLRFSDKINCFLGPNGSGKTNLLDAVQYLSLTKSAFNTVDSQNILFGEQLFTVRGHFVKEKTTIEVTCAVVKGQKKIVKVNKKEHDKLSDHIGMFPVVLMTPDDTDIIRDSSEIRRKFYDTILSQLDRKYLQALIEYNHLLKQRNSLLKQFGNGLSFDQDLLEPYDIKLVTSGMFLFEKRKSFLEEFQSKFKESYEVISSHKENVSIEYHSDLENEEFDKLLKKTLQRDLVLERTTTGIHKDDFKFFIDNHSLKKFGSQGQQKAFVIALKLANYHVICNNIGFKPILLLDDIYDKLDSDRISSLMNIVSGDSFGQIFITDARQERTRTILNELNLQSTFFQVENGLVKTTTKYAPQK